MHVLGCDLHLSHYSVGVLQLLTSNSRKEARQDLGFKDGRATDSCFALIGAHQCGILMDGLWLYHLCRMTNGGMVVTACHQIGLRLPSLL